MIIYILTPQGEEVTEDPTLVTMWQQVLDSILNGGDTQALTQAYDARVIEMFGPGARHLGSEQ